MRECAFEKKKSLKKNIKIFLPISINLKKKLSKFSQFDLKIPP